MSHRPPTSSTRLVLIPSYNSGLLLALTVRAALQSWSPVWVVLDGSTDGSDDVLKALQADHPDLRVVHLKRNEGKGAAVLAGMRAARQAGFAYALVMDADGQHPAAQIPRLMRLSEQNPSAMILGEPEFSTEAPLSRKHGRRIGNWWTHLETLWGGIADSLFGFRVYPLQQSIEIMDSIAGGRRYDFDTQLAVRLYWRGVIPINVKVPVRYLSAAEGGISHFQYLRDNLLLVRTHIGLVLGMLVRTPELWSRRKRA